MEKKILLSFKSFVLHLQQGIQPATWCLVAELGTCNTLVGMSLSSRKKLLGGKQRKGSQGNPDLAPDNSRPCFTTFSMIGLCWTTKISFLV